MADPPEDEALEMLAVMSYVAHLCDRCDVVEPAQTTPGRCWISYYDTPVWRFSRLRTVMALPMRTSSTPWPVALAVDEIGDDPLRYLMLGPDRAGNLLELVVLDRPNGPAVIHAMAMRKQYRRLLPKGQ